MPTGKTHLRIELGVFVLCGMACAYLMQAGVLHWREVACFCGCYLFSSLFLSPDLDLHRSRASRRWGIARVLWSPYACIFRHRGLSHHVLLGPLTRILYLGAMAAFVVWCVGLATGRPRTLSLPAWPLVAAGLVGVFLPNLIHALTDSLVSRVDRGSRRHT